ncbi:Arylsulfatase [Roseibium album]|nr:Arylsulfatase [Roseibium album]
MNNIPNFVVFLVLASLGAATGATAQPAPIVHDAEYDILFAQHENAWTEQDESVDQRLRALREANGGKPPNIFYILIDDVSFGQMGIPIMNDVSGIATPSINQFAAEGAALTRMYTEVSCTPTRTAMLTGRLPVRAGVTDVKGVIVGEGLDATEVTIAEVLKKSGYNTSHVGKWHQGDINEAFPHNQGFDRAAFPVHQQVQLGLMTPEGAASGNLVGWHPSGQSPRYVIDAFFKPFGLVTGLEAEAGGTAHEIDLKPGEEWTQSHYVEMNERYQRQTLEELNRLASEDEPFFLQYWPLWPVNFVQDGEYISRNGGFQAEKLQVLDRFLGEVFDKVDELGIGGNTIVVLMSDNGLMYHFEGKSGFSQLIYRGGKTQHLEGGVRVDAYVRWPDAIKPGTRIGDIVHVSDLFTTFARIGGGTEFIPRDRIIDGIDQTALLLEGDGNGRRDYVYIYEGPVLRSVVKQEFKFHLPAPGGTAATAGVYNLLRDPREMFPFVENSLWSSASFQDMVKRHQKKIAEYPHLPLGTDVPYEGIDNLRPESIKARELFFSRN